MNNALILAIILASLSTAILAADTGKPVLRVFYKNKRPSQKTLAKINETLDKFRDRYVIHYHDIEDEANRGLIHSLGLPSTHFPVAVVIEGKFTAQFGDRIASFVHFLSFMHGIGRHEGNWSISDLKPLCKTIACCWMKTSPELEGHTEGECE